jgi:hypothetical protein
MYERNPEKSCVPRGVAVFLAVHGEFQNSLAFFAGFAILVGSARCDLAVLFLPEGARYPFFSRDGKWLAFFAKGQLKKLAVPDGPVQPLCHSDIVVRDPEWQHDGSIVFADMGDAHRGGLRRLPADCGAVAIVTQPDSNAGETEHFFPQVLDGGAVLFTTRRSTDAGIRVSHHGRSCERPVRPTAD